ncbi:hypothetical protein RHECNPAF_430057 [Rhizobium etli CNPAF512]|nr:hypothetical protein RHECNPAF_430057 [Rhizobium etli CNPAF512]
MARPGIDVGHHQQTFDRIANWFAIRLGQPQIAECLQMKHDPSSVVHHRILQLAVDVGQARNRQAFGQRHQFLPDIRILDGDKRLVERQSFLRRQEFVQLARLTFDRSGAAVLEEKADGHAKDLGNALKTAGADAIRSFFVFLNLLKGNAQKFSQTMLGHPERLPPNSHAVANIDVDRIRRFGLHVNRSPALSARPPYNGEFEQECN